jgi:methyltransferase (TIGR00027 family)
MKEGPSRTAMAAAMHRAAHQQQEQGRVFADPLAVAIVGSEGADHLEAWGTTPHRRPMRFFIAARHRVAEDRLAAAVAAGTRQIVIVGAGLDTTALRQLHAETGARYFEVDHPATQAWKRERLAETGLELPKTLVFAPVDFERQTLADGLAEAGFDATRPAFFIWLGVVPYLTEDAIFATLRTIAGVPGAEVVSTMPTRPTSSTRCGANRRRGGPPRSRRSASRGSASSTATSWRGGSRNSARRRSPISGQTRSAGRFSAIPSRRPSAAAATFSGPAGRYADQRRTRAGRIAVAPRLPGRGA